MNKLCLVICAVLIGFQARASDLHQAYALHWTQVTPSPSGKPYRFQWPNPTGQPIYIKRIGVWISSGLYPVGGVLRQSDQTVLIYLPADYEEDYSPDYFLVNPNDGLELRFIAFGPSAVCHIGYWVWYSFTP